jgi:predicted ATPase/class 3 adenylate cyclase
MRCQSCSAANPARAKFCLECGSPLPVSARNTTRAPVVAEPEAERRQLTCLFCDLESSVELSERLDPEELREVLAAYQHVCATVVRRFEGHIARYFGDGILVYFGFPTAHEDEAERAVRSALGIVEAVGQLNTRLEQSRGIRLKVRIGIHTGLVVAGDIAAGEQLESMAAIGDTPNIAARLQALAAPDSVVISSATYQLVAGYFDCRELGFRPLRGLSQPMAIHQVLHESGARSRLDIAARRGLAPMTGRDTEMAVLANAWQAACAANGSVALVAGEPGIGKSRLMWALHEHVAQSPEAYVVQVSCSPFYVHTAFYPVIDLLERGVLQFESDDPVEQRLDKIEGFLAQYGFDLPQVVPLLAKLLSVAFEDRYPPLDLPADRQKQLTMDALVKIVLLRAEHQPVLLVVEDLHWADPSSLDLFTRLIESTPLTRQLVIFTFRSDFTPPWSVGPGVLRLNLNRLDRDASVEIVSEIAGKPLPAEVLGQLLGKADGVPLYLEELTKLVLDLGLLQANNGHVDLAGPLPRLAIPATLADSLMARLDRLSGGKNIAQLGATIGRHFAYDLLVAVLRAIGPVDEHALKRDLASLVESELLFVERRGRDANYTFKHALIQDAAYESLLHSTRRQYHRRIAEVLVQDFPTTLEVAPELLAHHYTQAGLIAESMPYWLRAGQRALHASANSEAIAQLKMGLDLLGGLPAGPERDGQELQLLLALGPAYMATRGYAAPEVEAAYDRARELCRALGDSPQLAPVLHGLWTYHIVRAQHRRAFELAQEVLAMGMANGDQGLQIQGNMDVGWSHFFHGRLSAAREHLERVLALYDHERHSSHAFTFGDNPATSAGNNLAQVLWLLGYPDASLHRSEQTLETLRSVIKHPYSVAFGLDLAAVVRQYRGDAPSTRALVDEAIALSTAQGLAFIGAMAAILHGWVLTQEGKLEAGLTQMRAGLASQLATGAELAKPYWLCLTAEACGRRGAAAEGLDLLSQAEAAVELTDERYWEAEIYRLRGQLLLSDPPSNEHQNPTTASAEACYQRAIDTANQQGARSLALRAVIGLVELWRQVGRTLEAHDLLVTTYSWFTEGQATPDLQQAAALLAELDTPTNLILAGGD